MKVWKMLQHEDHFAHYQALGQISVVFYFHIYKYICFCFYYYFHVVPPSLTDSLYLYVYCLFILSNKGIVVAHHLAHSEEGQKSRKHLRMARISECHLHAISMFLFWEQTKKDNRNCKHWGFPNFRSCLIIICSRYNTYLPNNEL